MAKVGDTLIIDGIASTVVYDAGDDLPWGRYLLVDKNHDLPYYFSGSDWINYNYDTSSPGNCCWEWGGYGVTTNTTAQNVGDGLNNTNYLISLNLQSNTTGWWTVWRMVSLFRQEYSNRWFVPSLEELKRVYEQSNKLNSFSRKNNTVYWSSSSDASSIAYTLDFKNGTTTYNDRNSHTYRTRMCRYATSVEFRTFEDRIKEGDIITAEDFIYILDDIDNRIALAKKELESKVPNTEAAYIRQLYGDINSSAQKYDVWGCVAN